VRSLSLVLLAGLVLGLAPSGAQASTIFDVSATVGGKVGGGTGAATGESLLGTITIDTVGGSIVSLSLQLASNPNIFTGFSGCPGTCTNIFDTGFADFGFLDLIGNAGTLVGYAGGALKADSTLDTASIQYVLTGSVTNPASVPEPSFYPVFLLGLGGLYLVKRRRRA
jgi:hypothetical protein